MFIKFQILSKKKKKLSYSKIKNYIKVLFQMPQKTNLLISSQESCLNTGQMKFESTMLQHHKVMTVHTTECRF